jgi:ferrochelatase
MEVLYDLDDEAAAAARDVGIAMVRAETVGTHPRFVTMIRKLIQERLDPDVPREAIGRFGPAGNVCAEDCCPPPARPPVRTPS